MLSTNTEKDHDYWEWSGNFDITQIGYFQIMLRNKDKSKFKYIKATINSEYHEIFIIFEDQPKESASLKIRNKCEDLDIKVYQTCLSSSEGLIIKPYETIPFAWTHPNKDRQIYVDFMRSRNYYYHSFDDIFNFDAINKTTAFPIPSENGQIMQIYTNVIIEGTSRILVFYPRDPNSTRKLKKLFFKKLVEKIIKEKMYLQVHLKIKGIGISFVSTLKAKKNKTYRSEIIYMIIKYVDLLVIKSNIQNTFHFRIKYFNIDSNVNFVTAFPVLMTPTLPKALRDPNAKKYFLDIVSYGAPLIQNNVLFILITFKLNLIFYERYQTTNLSKFCLMALP